MLIKPQEIQRIRRLASGDLEPLTGFERHFVRVCRGEAKPLTEEERVWFSIARDDSYEDSASQNNEEFDSIKSRCEDLQCLNDSLRARLSSLEDTASKISEQGTILVQKNQLLESTHQNLELALESSNRERSDLTQKIFEYESRLKILEETIIQEVDRRLSVDIIKIRENADRVQRINMDLARHNDELSAALKPFFPAYVICNECEGKGKWSLRDVTGDGVGFEHGATIEVCEKCHGLGKWENPERKRLGISVPSKR